MRRGMALGWALAGCGGGAGADDGGTGDGGETTGTATITTTVSSTSVSTTPEETSSPQDTSAATVSSIDESEGATASELCDPPCETADTPLCIGGACVGCTQAGDGDAACAAEFPMLPACHDDGRCVPCTVANASGCSPETPACDPTTNECVPCTEHAQCPETACDRTTGLCFDPACVREVDGDGGAEFTTISDAVADLGAGDECTIVVHGIDDPSPYPGYAESVAIQGARVAFLSADDPVAIVFPAGGPGFDVQNEGVVFLVGLRIQEGIAGVRASLGAHVDLERVWSFEHEGYDLELQGSSSARVRNSMLGGYRGEAQVISAYNSSFDVAYSTLATVGPSVVGCTLLGAGSRVRNSVLIAADTVENVSCNGLEIVNTATEAMTEGDGNVAIGELTQAGAEELFVDFGDGDLHLTDLGVGTFADVAVWEVGDPVVDLDGDPRGGRPGPDFAGADVP